MLHWPAPGSSGMSANYLQRVRTMGRKGLVGILLLIGVGLIVMPGAAAAQTIRRVSVASDGTQAENAGFQLYSYNPAVSADGRYVAFDSYAGNLVPNDTNNCANPGFPASSCRDIFVNDRVTGQTT